MGQWPSPCRDRIAAKTRRQTTCYKIRIALNCYVENRLAGIENLDDSWWPTNPQTLKQGVFENGPRRNACVANLAHRILILHAAQGGKTETLCQQALAAAKPVYTLPSPHNAHLIALGAQPISPETPRPPSWPAEPGPAPVLAPPPSSWTTQKHTNRPSSRPVPTADRQPQIANAQ